MQRGRNITREKKKKQQNKKRNEWLGGRTERGKKGRREEGEKSARESERVKGKEGEERKGEASVTGIPNWALVVLYHVETLRVGWGVWTNERLRRRYNYRAHHFIHTSIISMIHAGWREWKASEEPNGAGCSRHGRNGHNWGSAWVNGQVGLDCRSRERGRSVWVWLVYDHTTYCTAED